MRLAGSAARGAGWWAWRKARGQGTGGAHSTGPNAASREPGLGFGTQAEGGGCGKDYVAFSMFERYDLDGDGAIGPTELKAMCASLGRGVSDEELEKAMSHLDGDGSGQIGFDEFLEWWKAGLSQDTLLDRNKAKRSSLMTARQQQAVAEAANLEEDTEGRQRARIARQQSERNELRETDLGSSGDKARPGRHRERRGTGDSASLAC